MSKTPIKVGDVSTPASSSSGSLFQTPPSEPLPPPEVSPEMWPSINDDTSTENLITGSQYEQKECLQEELHFFFMSPIDKWRQRRQVPSKLIFQLLKIILVTIQLMSLGTDMSNYLSQEENMNNAFRETLLYEWDPTREVLAYPPSTGPYSVYTVSDFYGSLNYAIRQYANLTSESVGLFAYPGATWPNNSDLLVPILVERLAYRDADVKPAEHKYNISQAIERQRLWILNLYSPGDERWTSKFDVRAYLSERNFSIRFESLIELRLVLPLRTIYFNTGSLLDGHEAATCYDVNVSIVYDNRKHDGMIPVRLATEKVVKQCNEVTMVEMKLTPGHGQRSFTLRGSLFGLVVIFACGISTILCIRSLVLGQMLRMAITRFFRDYLDDDVRLSFEDKWNFIDFWLVMIMLNDVLNIAGTAMKIRLDSSEMVNSDHFTACSLFLGVGNLLVWVGLLRYLAYFRSYNVIMLTLRRSVPHVLRFFICAILIYCGFCCCGWVVLGPHHLKFRTLSRTSECLFSLMNGDDMFATFFITDVSRYTPIWWFSRVYLYLFICLFIYVVVSLFIAIILDAYDAVVDLYSKNSSKPAPKTPLEKFMGDVQPERLERRTAYGESWLMGHIHSCLDCFFPHHHHVGR